MFSLKKELAVIILITFSSIGLLVIAGPRSHSSIFSSSYAQTQQQQKTFAAILSGKSENPPVSTPATGTAKFTVNPNDTISYSLNANNINGVIGAQIVQTNGSLIAEIFNPYQLHNGKPDIPTGKITGTLSSGIISSDDLDGPMVGKKITDLANTMKGGKLFAEVRTQDHQRGEIKGQIVSG
jgi:hypothetical protein